MAFIGKRGGRKGVYVYYTDKDTGEQKQLPREQTKHLDNLSAQEVQHWVDEWENRHGVVKERAVRINLSPDDRLSALWSQYQKQRTGTTKRRTATTDSESGLFNNHIVPYFVGKHGKKRPEIWHELVPGFHSYLFQESKLKDQTIRYVLWALERFGQYLVWSRHMALPFSIQVPSREHHKITPLKVRLEPKVVLDFVRTPKLTEVADGRVMISDQELKLSALLGYFAGLRPSEQWALDKSDFLTGGLAEKSTRTLWAFRKHGLGTKLSVLVTKTWQPRGGKIEELTKTHYSRGVVNIWNVEAAQLIAQMIKGLPDGRLFSASYYGMFQAWRKRVLPVLKVTPHDLRRASGLYLGRTARIELTLLQEHMRHAELETTALYIREPDIPDVKNKSALQDFDDVV